jgi:predicted AAA+ superfamily ATPase
MKYINRDLQKLIEEWFFRHKVIVLYGARQVGKTTLVKEILSKHKGNQGYFNCELLPVKQLLERQDLSDIKRNFGEYPLIVLDEAQKINQIGLLLKMIHDTYPEIQLIATGSSSFTLSSQVSEPLTGRGLEFMLYPFSYSEMGQLYRPIDLRQQINTILLFGLYPEIVMQPVTDSIFLLNNLTSKYLYQDVFEFETIKRPLIIVQLLQSLAFQIGSEVSHHELANQVKANVKTVERYLDLLEKAFVIYRLKALSRNLRNEIGTKEKIYFYDLGIRNSLINQFNPITLRNDVGALWENFCIMERIKLRQIQKKQGPVYFWRTHEQKEIDYVEEENGEFSGFEFKWNPEAKLKQPHQFLEKYKGTLTVVSPSNIDWFLNGQES